MKSNTYMDRAMKARDPRFARILGKLGYERRDMVPAPKKAPKPTAGDEKKALRAEYERVIGKRAFHGWDAETLRQKISEAKG